MLLNFYHLRTRELKSFNIVLAAWF